MFNALNNRCCLATTSQHREYQSPPSVDVAHYLDSLRLNCEQADQKVPLFKVMNKWKVSEKIEAKAFEVGLREKAVDHIFKEFLKYVRKELIVKDVEQVRDLPAINSRLNDEWIRFLINYVPEQERERFNSLCESADLRTPAAWYPAARLMKREIILHVGPTNSGKTHTALDQLITSASGIYCGPLRMLAQEIYDRLTDRGIACSLMTGERHFEVPGARLTSCTVEMANLAKEYDVAVIDEIQMIGDPARGWAWTQAVLGLRASRIYLCGEPSAVPLIKQLVATTGDTLVERHFERLMPLQIESSPVSKQVAGIKPGALLCTVLGS